MKTEIEAKFINVNHDDIRLKLEALGAELEQPMRTMRRVVIHTPSMSEKNAFIRVRDEGHRTTVTYKQFDEDTVEGSKEYETIVDDFDTIVNILAQGGLEHDTYQESRRENWRIENVEIMLDEWPWLNPYVEIEADSEQDLKNISVKLGLKWEDALFGGVANIYLNQYPHIGEEGVNEINQNWPVIKFDDDPPGLLSIK